MGEKRFISGDWKAQMHGALCEDGFTVFAPTVDGEITRFAPCESADTIQMGVASTRVPMKQVFFPMTETMLNFDYSPGKDLTFSTPEQAEEKIAVLGCRPCDAGALGVLDEVFNWDYEDSFYNQHRAGSLIVTVGCSEGDDKCFCTSLGLAPDGTEGSDILLQEIEGKGALATACTEKGEAFVAKHADLFAGAPKGAAPAVASIAAREDVDPDRIKQWLDTHFDDPLWEDVAMKCLGCGACSYLCPTCHCFDVVDEADWKEGERRRNYDCCSYALFTLHTSGHNPRPTTASRCRNRVMHKFKYFQEKFNRRACVGCGRCVRVCGAGQDLVDILARITAAPMAAAVAEESA